MIYLIGGSPRCGKSTLAQEISKKLSISWIATDTLESIISAETSKIAFSKRFPKSAMRRQTRDSNDRMYKLYSAKEIAKAYLKQSKSVWQAIDALVECELFESMSYVIEGYHLQPVFVRYLSNKYGSNKFRVAYLVRTDIDSIVNACVNHSSQTDWVVGKTKDTKVYRDIGKMISELGHYFLINAKKYKLTVFEMDHHFKTNLTRAKKYLLDSR